MNLSVTQCAQLKLAAEVQFIPKSKYMSVINTSVPPCQYYLFVFVYFLFYFVLSVLLWSACSAVFSLCFSFFWVFLPASPLLRPFFSALHLSPLIPSADLLPWPDFPHYGCLALWCGVQGLQIKRFIQGCGQIAHAEHWRAQSPINNHCYACKNGGSIKIRSGSSFTCAYCECKL